MKLRILEILKEKKKTKYWLYNQLGLSYQNFNKIVNNQTAGIIFSNVRPTIYSKNIIGNKAISGAKKALQISVCRA